MDLDIALPGVKDTSPSQCKFTRLCKCTSNAGPEDQNFIICLRDVCRIDREDHVAIPKIDPRDVNIRYSGYFRPEPMKLASAPILCSSIASRTQVKLHVSLSLPSLVAMEEATYRLLKAGCKRAKGSVVYKLHGLDQYDLSY